MPTHIAFISRGSSAARTASFESLGVQRMPFFMTTSFRAAKGNERISFATADVGQNDRNAGSNPYEKLLPLRPGLIKCPAMSGENNLWHAGPSRGETTKTAGFRAIYVNYIRFLRNE
jgi:hypothetical protein